MKIEDYTLPKCELKIHKVQQCVVYLSALIHSSSSKFTLDERQALYYIYNFMSNELREDIKNNLTKEGWRDMLLEDYKKFAVYLPIDIRTAASRKYLSLFPDDEAVSMQFATFNFFRVPNKYN